MKSPRRSRGVRILTADPGFAKFGFGVVHYVDGEEMVLDMGTISTDPAKSRKVLKSEDQWRRLRETSDALLAVSKRHLVDGLAFESLSLPQQTSKQVAVSIGFPYGLLAMLCSALDIPGVMLTPQAVKKALCGVNNASKEDVEAAVEARFGKHPAVREFSDRSTKANRSHAYDALGVYVGAEQTEVMRALKRSAG